MPQGHPNARVKRALGSRQSSEVAVLGRLEILVGVAMYWVP